MKTFILQLYSDMRVVVQQRDGVNWEVWPQKFYDGKWNDHKGPAVSVRMDRTQAMIDALAFSGKLMRAYQQQTEG